jgi:hypothetical protein
VPPQTAIHIRGEASRVLLVVILGLGSTLVVAVSSALFRLPFGRERVAIRDFIPPTFGGDDQLFLSAWQDPDCEVFLAVTHRRDEFRFHGIPLPDFMQPQEVDAAELVPAWAWWQLVGRYESDAHHTDGLRWLAAFGWPFSALWYEYGLYLRGNTYSEGGVTVEVPWKRWSGRDYYVNQLPVIIPYRPIWAGLILNTALHASLWWLVLFGPGITRRALRRRRGLCPRCAYDLHALPLASPCPECGRSPTAS